MAKDYTGLRTLLAEQETFPLDYIHKVIGRKSAAFERGVAELERAFPGLVRTGTRDSSDHAFVALTYTYRAADVEAVITLMRATDGIEDLRIVL